MFATGFGFINQKHNKKKTTEISGTVVFLFLYEVVRMVKPTFQGQLFFGTGFRFINQKQNNTEISRTVVFLFLYEMVYMVK